MASITVEFSIPVEDLPRLDRLVETYANGDRSAFLLVAMKHMEVHERSARLRELQTHGVQQRTSAGLDEVDIESVVYRVLSNQRQPNG
jgi:hypothetical protein